MKRKIGWQIVTLLALACIAISQPLAIQAAEREVLSDFAAPEFKTLWNRTDKLVDTNQAARSYLWGPKPFTQGIREVYADSPDGERLVQYFDKSRMEITQPGNQMLRNSNYYVTNGLLARELMSGQMQMGDKKFEERKPAQIGVAGDADDTTGPTYATLNKLTDPATDKTGKTVGETVYRDGNMIIKPIDFAGKYNITYAHFEPTTNHNVAAPFWTYLNQSGPVLNTSNETVMGRLFEPTYFATGLPITEAYWSQVKVGGIMKDVLIQAFERRILTYTPSNPAQYQVEMGNVGQHYYEWRYNSK